MRHTEKIKKILKNRILPIESTSLSQSSSVIVAIGKDLQKLQSEKILVMKRSQEVDTHKGQMSLPGGFVEKGDQNLMDTALREIEEEIGLKRIDIEIVGPLEMTYTRGGIPIYPWVGTFNLPYSFKPNPMEVEKIFFLSIDKLIQDGIQPVTVKIDGKLIQSKGIHIDGELVWGATGRILETFRNLLLS